MTTKIGKYKLQDIPTHKLIAVGTFESQDYPGFRELKTPFETVLFRGDDVFVVNSEWYSDAIPGVTVYALDQAVFKPFTDPEPCESLPR